MLYYIHIYFIIWTHCLRYEIQCADLKKDTRNISIVQHVCAFHFECKLYTYNTQQINLFIFTLKKKKYLSSKCMELLFQWPSSLVCGNFNNFESLKRVMYQITSFCWSDSLLPVQLDRYFQTISYWKMALKAQSFGNNSIQSTNLNISIKTRNKPLIRFILTIFWCR